MAYRSAISRREFIRLVYTHTRVLAHRWVFFSSRSPTSADYSSSPAYYFDLAFKHTCSGRKSQTRARERDGAEQREGERKGKQRIDKVYWLSC